MEKLEDLRNIGKTIARRLRKVGIESPDDLKKLGSVMAYKTIQAQLPQKLPVCYNLYSLEGAIVNKDWRLISDIRKKELIMEAERSH